MPPKRGKSMSPKKKENKASEVKDMDEVSPPKMEGKIKKVVGGAHPRMKLRAQECDRTTDRPTDRPNPEFIKAVFNAPLS